MKLSWRLMTGFIAVALASIHFLFVIAPGRSPAQSLKPAIRSQQVPESAKGSPAETKESLRSFVLSEDHESVFPERPLPEAERVLSRGAVTERRSQPSMSRKFVIARTSAALQSSAPVTSPSSQQPASTPATARQLASSALS